MLGILLLLIMALIRAIVIAVTSIPVIIILMIAIYLVLLLLWPVTGKSITDYDFYHILKVVSIIGFIIAGIFWDIFGND